MAGIATRILYKQKLIPCVPSNNKDSEGSSDSQAECEISEKPSRSNKKKVRKGCVVPIPEESYHESDVENSEAASSASSGLCWKRKGVQPSVTIIPESEHSMSTVPSPCSSLLTNISSSNDSINTLTPSPSTLSKLRALKTNAGHKKKRGSIFKKPTVTICDRYNPHKTIPSGHTQPCPMRNVFANMRVHSKILVNTQRQLSDSFIQKPDSLCNIQPTKKSAAGSSARARKTLEAVSPKKPLVDLNCNVSDLSLPRLLTQRKRPLKPVTSANKENNSMYFEIILSCCFSVQNLLGIL